MRRAASFVFLLAASAASADETSWAEVRGALWPGRAVAEAAGLVTLDAPARAADDRAVPVTVEARAPDGAAIRRVTLVVDDNPAPVSAALEALAPADALTFGVTLRLNGPSDLRAVLETADGRLFMAATRVKTSGLGACAAPPGVDEATAMATLGRMTLDGAGALEADDDLRLRVAHPSYSGLQMDQVTLLFRPARFVETVEIEGDAGPLWRVTGSISLSENPVFAFDRPEGSDALRVRVTDSDGAVFERRFGLGDS
jgi:sulfur-oxidizing protein SoxY